MNVSVGERLKNIRELRDLSQKEAASLIGISSQALSNYERAQRDPDTDVLIKIATAYDVSVDYLLGLIKHPTRLSNKDMKFLDMINDESVQLWWIDLPTSDIEKLKTLKEMWELLNKRNF